ncbi:ABC transporter ATP-binding protein [Streptomyces aureoverticillatus]|uniref:ABC transporter ATP-binding protein n=1 Tax=Streptomyces aureoverticillatus TaxID=66871 RepID=UPI0013D9D145|nr:ABC transporter ATP-binding protein [Streptomyces aureoverticillatus]QIB45637.1 ABC transporter ATP-binding protein [Streptomyces aureoverticillatus]
MSGTTSPDTQEVVRLDAVHKIYGGAKGQKNQVTALDGVSIGLDRGTFTAVMGPSGSGKSTFLHCAAGLDRPTSGSVRLDGVELSALKERALTKLRRERIGFIFQAFNLLPALSVLDNVTLPLRLAGRRPKQDAVDEVLQRVGLAGMQQRRPGELSGGQQQRVAIARALVTEPAVIFGDEPTGALDTHTAREVLILLREAVQWARQTIVMVTHDPVAAAHADRVVFLADGRIVSSLERPTPDQVAERMTHLGAWGTERVAPEAAQVAERVAGAGVAAGGLGQVPGAGGGSGQASGGRSVRPSVQAPAWEGLR